MPMKWIASSASAIGYGSSELSGLFNSGFLDHETGMAVRHDPAHDAKRQRHRRAGRMTRREAEHDRPGKIAEQVRNHRSGGRVARRVRHSSGARRRRRRRPGRAGRPAGAASPSGRAGTGAPRLLRRTTRTLGAARRQTASRATPAAGSPSRRAAGRPLHRDERFRVPPAPAPPSVHVRRSRPISDARSYPSSPRPSRPASIGPWNAITPHPMVRKVRIEVRSL